MKIQNRERSGYRRAIDITVGVIVGGTILHVYSMIVYRLTTYVPPRNVSEFMQWFWMAAHPRMWCMAALFGIFGGAIGYVVTRLREHTAEIEARKAVQRTLEELTFTVAHYVRSANSVIGGQSRRLLSRSTLSTEDRTKIEQIRDAADRIEAVVASLAQLNADTPIEPVGKTQIRMLDIRDLLDTEMKRLETASVQR